jgi:hypothetical protein
MVSRLIVFIFGWRCAAWVSSATVQRCAPGGGSEQASSVTCASTVHSIAVWPTSSTLHDLRLGHSIVRDSRNVSPVELPGRMQTLGTKLIHNAPVSVVQAQLGLSHTRYLRVPQIRTFSLFCYLPVAILMTLKDKEEIEARFNAFAEARRKKGAKHLAPTCTEGTNLRGALPFPVEPRNSYRVAPQQKRGHDQIAQGKAPEKPDLPAAEDTPSDKRVARLKLKFLKRNTSPLPSVIAQKNKGLLSA